MFSHLPVSVRFSSLTRRATRAARSVLGLALLPLVLLAAPTSTSTLPAANTPPLRLNEVLALNTKIGNAGTFPDLIELHNASAAVVDLSGKSLTDDPLLPRKFVFPSGTTLAPGGYLTVFADRATSAPGLHTGFALDAEGDQVRLYDTPAAGGGLLDSIVFGFQIPDHSVARTGADGGTWTLTTPTPSAANAAPATLGNLAALRVNEWAGKITFRLDHDLIELFNAASLPVALGGVKLTDNPSEPNRFVFPPLSFMAPGGFLPLYGADFVFGLDGNNDPILLLGANGETIDHVTLNSQPNDVATGRTPDGSATIAHLPVPSPGISNQTPLPPAYAALLAQLRITEVMFQPSAPASAGDYEFIELQNTGTTPLDLSGVRFTNGLDYTFRAGTTLAPGAVTVVARNRSAFLSRYPEAAGALAAGDFDGSLDNTGETLALTLPAPWYVHILRFRFEPTWQPSTAGGGHSLVVPGAATTPAEDWRRSGTWRASTVVNGSPGAAEPSLSSSARLTNLSVRTTMAASQTLIVGMVVSHGSRNILVRAAGPALAEFGLTTAMGDPRLELYNGGTLMFQNDDWPAGLANTFGSVGAFPFTPSSRDAAFMLGIDGARTIQARGTGAGVVLVEAYETAGGSAAARLINVSALNRVGVGDDLLIAGFTVGGEGGKRLLIRGVGPRLATTPFNVPGALLDPVLELYQGTTKIDENDNWPAALASTFTAVGAFALEANSRDAALLRIVNPGSYTVQVRGANAGTGEALIEIYEVP